METTLPLPEGKPGDPLLMGFFMTGAYQEILGDMHNLFGDTHSVDVHGNDAGEYTVSDATTGDTVAKVLRYVNFEPAALLQSYQRQFEASHLSEDEQSQLLGELRNGLEGYTYLEE